MVEAACAWAPRLVCVPPSLGAHFPGCDPTMRPITAASFWLACKDHQCDICGDDLELQVRVHARVYAAMTWRCMCLCACVRAVHVCVYVYAAMTWRCRCECMSVCECVRAVHVGMLWGCVLCARVGVGGRVDERQHKHAGPWRAVHSQAWVHAGVAWLGPARASCTFT